MAFKEMKLGEPEIEGYYNLDSKLKEPQLIGDKSSFLEYLGTQLEENKELFLVVSTAVSNSNSWKVESPS